MKTNANSNLAHSAALDTMLSRRKKPWIRRLSAILIVIAIIVLALNTKKEKTDSVRFKTEEIQRGDLTVIVTATGTLQPTNKVEVGSELSGKIESVEADYNDKVTVGQVLAKIDTSKLEAQVTQSRAALEAAQAKLLEVQATLVETGNKLTQYKHVRQLSANKVPSQTEYDAAEAAYNRALADEASAQAAISQAQATLKVNETDLSKAVIRSPINGVVLTRNVESGQTVAASFETPVLFTLAEDLALMELHINVDEADIGQVSERQKAVFRVDAYPERLFEAEIIQIRYGSETVEGVVTYETVLKVNNPDLALRPGMTATADITVLNIENALLVSGSALRFQMTQPETAKRSGGLVGTLLPRPPAQQAKQKESSQSKEKQVWLLKDGQPQPVMITTGATDGLMTQVLEGDLEPGMQVITDSITKGMN